MKADELVRFASNTYEADRSVVELWLMLFLRLKGRAGSRPIIRWQISTYFCAFIFNSGGGSWRTNLKKNLLEVMTFLAFESKYPL